MSIPRDLHATCEDGNYRLRIGGRDLSDLLISKRGPIVERIAEGPDLYIAWVPFLFEGTVHDEVHSVRVVNEGDAERVTDGVPREAR